MDIALDKGIDIGYPIDIATKGIKMKCPVIVMGYGNTLVKLTVGTRVTMLPTKDPNAVGSEYAGSIGTIIDTPSFLIDTYEIEMGASHNFQHVYATEDQFKIYEPYENFYTSAQQDWKRDGLCPHCGEKGFFSNFAFVCTKHGQY